MAKVILKDPNEPSAKKPRVPVEKKKPVVVVEAKQSRFSLALLFKLSIFLNFWLIKLVVYLLNKPFFDVLFLKLLNNIKRLF